MTLNDESSLRCQILTPPKSHTLTARLVDQNDTDTSDIKERNARWPDGVITYKLISYSKDPRILELQDKVLTVALRAIQLRVKNIRFKRIYDDAPSDIRVEWHHDLTVFKGNNNVLAQAYYPTNRPRTSRFSGLIQFNDNHEWSIYGNNNTQPMLHVMMHELGHSLGLVHDVNHSESVMYPYCTGKIKWSKRDLQRLWSFYGKRTISQRILDYFIKRRQKGYDFD